MAADPRVTTVQQWAQREATGVDKITARTQAVVKAQWETFAQWYALEQTAKLADNTAAALNPARDIVGGLGLAYMQQLLGSLGQVRTPTIKLNLPAPRRGADLTDVYSRPAATYRFTYAMTGDVEEARTAAFERLDRMLEDDLTVAQRDGEQRFLRAMGLQRYRRLIHPELSRGGSCGLCVVASDQIYKTEDLRPIHGRCRCSSAPILEDFDPGEANKVDLAAAYAAAGDSTHAHDLKRTRFQVNEHGELGPILTRKGDHFEHGGPRETTVEQAITQLRALEPVLESLQRRAAAGENVDEPLRYQLGLVTKLRGLAAAA